jgi:hypothetical protein
VESLVYPWFTACTVWASFSAPAGDGRRPDGDHDTPSGARVRGLIVPVARRTDQAISTHLRRSR